MTVVCYHRVTPYPEPSFDVFPGTVSATPEVFAAQMDLLADRHNVISMDQLVAWLEGDGDLPPRPAVVTFDDGYADNHTHAFPILRERGLPATVFLTTGLIETGAGAWWDRVAHAFHHTTASAAELPLIGAVSWRTEIERDAVRDRFTADLKALSESAKLSTIEDLQDRLGVAPDGGAFDGLYLTWDQVREMDAGGFTAAAHTVTHPILTRLPAEEARREIVDSVARVSQEVGRPIRAFAYPNGRSGDLDDAVVDLVADAGVVAAFTLSPGPARASEAIAEPLRIPRIYIDRRHGPSALAAQLEGVARLADNVTRRRSRTATVMTLA